MNNGFHGFPGSIKPPYKVYTALLTQTSTNPPIANVLENTIGDIIWSYEGVGIYNATLIGAFIINKIYCPNITIASTPAFLTNNINVNFIEFLSNEGDGVLNNTPIEIRIYN